MVDSIKNNNTAEQIALDLAHIVRGIVYTDIINRAAYSTDSSIYRIVPKCVVMPKDAGDIIAVIKFAGQRKIPVAARGAGSGTAGESLCDGIVIDITRYMNKIIGTKDQGQTITCEPGVVLDDLNKYLADYDRKIGPDPSSSNRAVVGACLANNSTGAHWLQYGYIGDYVQSLEAVLADGNKVEFKNDFDPLETPNSNVSKIASQCLSLLLDKQQLINDALPKTRRNRSGYSIAGICHDDRIDLARLFAGSEGTLAVFTKITLRTVPVPSAKAILQLEFDSLEKMADAVPIIVESGASACELMDKSLIDLAFKALPEYRDILPADSAAVLLVEHTGQSAEKVKEKIQKTDSAVGSLSSGRTLVFDPLKQKRIWKSRKDAGPLLYQDRSKKHPAEFMEDVAVDHHQLKGYIAGLKEIGKRYDFTMSFYGHAGDSELHLRPYLDLSEPAEREKMLAIANDVFSLAWSLGGSISGEHADGLARTAFIRRQYGDEYYKLLCEIKNIFDPQGILNPGKIINEDPELILKNLRREHKILPERTQSDLLFEKDELEQEIEQCNGCGLCLSRESDMRMCPVFRAMGEELAVSRAKANLLHFWATGQLDEKDFESPEFHRFLNLCINCKACQLQCPSGVDISKLMTVARAQYVKRKGLSRTEKLLSNNRYLNMFGSALSPLSNFAMRLSAFAWLLEKFAGLEKSRKMPQFKPGSFLKTTRKYLSLCEPVREPIDKVAYFTDTFVNYNDHELGFAVIDVLRSNNIEVTLPEQLPAPLPAIVYGNVKRAKSDLAYSVGHLAKAVRDGYKIVCSEPSAALCLKDELGHYVGGQDAKLVSENTYELMNYLLGLYNQGKLKSRTSSNQQTPTERFVYHLPCHLCALGDETATIKLLHELCGIEVANLSAGCCGIAGTFGMQKKNYELSSKIGSELKNALENSPIENVLTECSTCKMQIEHISNSQVSHPIKILARCQSSDTSGS
ncbi:anaerobic glycerol-3-phosphate dehydrogenase subunit C [Planctomycetota bacterium]